MLDFMQVNRRSRGRQVILLERVHIIKEPPC